ncbi:MAG: acyltransferase family protein [Burkholderiales bacterium]
MTGDAAPAATRRFFLDWLRIAAFALLVPYHVGMYYVTWDWHVKSPFAGPAIEPLMRIANPWRMPLLFFVSGAVTAFMLARAGATGALLRERAGRLLRPLLFGMLVVVPPQSFFEVRQKHGYEGGFASFMRLYLGGADGFCGPGGCIAMPTWNHLWFLPYLMTYTAVLWLVLRRWPDALDAAADAASRRMRGAALLGVPIVAFAAERWAVRDAFPITHALLGDWHAHAIYGSVFVLGAMSARADRWERFESLRWPALGATVLGWLALVCGTPDAVRTIGAASMQWGGVVAAVGFAYRHWNRDGRWRAALTEAVFPLYLLHQTVIIVVAMGLARWRPSPALEAPLLALAAFGVPALVYLLVRRIGPLRPWFGLARVAAATPPPGAARARGSQASA